jgi:hypothetical protein
MEAMSMVPAAERTMERVISDGGVRKLAGRERLPVDPRRSIAVKRDVHEFVVEAEADAFAAAFREVMTDPAGRFGLIRVKRPAERMGREFVAGERFQGCYSVGAALLGLVERRPLLHSLVARALSTRAVRWLVGRIEDAMLSDYAVIDELVLRPDVSKGEIHTLKYSYLDGTPIAGSSRFSIESRGAGRCLVRQIFEYQEVNAIALGTFQRFGLKMHDQVVHMQIHKAAARAGAAVSAGTIPLEYANLSS